ncbi:MAG: hypothetical protein WDM86_00295 [Rhizomicrobium sp.]
MQPAPLSLAKNVRFVLFKKPGFAVVARGNDYTATLAGIGAAMKGLGIKGALDLDNRRHHTQAGHLKGFTRNPAVAGQDHISDGRLLRESVRLCAQKA